METSIIDTHAHIYADEFSKDLDETIERSKEAGISKIYMPNVDSTSIDSMLEVEAKYPDYCVPMMGLHPCSVKKDFEKELYIVEDWLSKREFVAVGEIGLDFYWDKAHTEQQYEALKIQVDMATKMGLPIILHCRESLDEIISFFKERENTSDRGIFHCFNGTVEQAEDIKKLGFLVGLGGVTTFKNSGMKDVLNEIGVANAVLETDSPYLAPVPFRGKRNEPSYTKKVADFISDTLSIGYEEVANVTTNNAMNLFTKRKQAHG